VTLHLFAREVRRSAARPFLDASLPRNVPPVPMTQVDPEEGWVKLRIEECACWEHNACLPVTLLSCRRFYFHKGGEKAGERERERERETESNVVFNVAVTT